MLGDIPTARNLRDVIINPCTEDQAAEFIEAGKCQRRRARMGKN